MRQTKVATDQWPGLYTDSWQGVILPEAFSHPAKMARALCRHIFDHARAGGWITPGSVVLEPFLGIGTTVFEALLHGCAVVGCELEPAFFRLAQENVALWCREYHHLPGFGPWALLVNGDSRRLPELLPGMASAVVTSPPFEQCIAVAKHAEAEDTVIVRTHAVDSTAIAVYIKAQRLALGLSHKDVCEAGKFYAKINHGGSCSNWEQGLSLPTPDQWRKLKNILHLDTRFDTAMLTVEEKPKSQLIDTGHHHCTDYGSSPGQLGAMPPGTLVVSSPPYADGCAHTGGTDPQPQHMQGGPLRWVDYGQSPGQLAGMVVTSPPYEESLDPRRGGHRHKIGFHQGETRGLQLYAQGYGTSTGQLGAESSDTFWSASHTILTHIYNLLRPGGHAIFVTKNYVRAGAIVDFTGQWAALCQQVGFVWLHHHQALLVEDHGTQGGLFGEDTPNVTQRKSFFRRLIERKRPDLAINYESVLCFVKPWTGAEDGGAALCVSNPPFGEQQTGGGIAVTGSPSQRQYGMRSPLGYVNQGTSPGNLGNMPPGTLDFVCTSPPYAGAGEVLGAHNGIDYTKTTGTGQRLTPGRRMQPYGTSAGQLGSMPPGDAP